MNGPLCRRMTASEGALWGLWQVGRRLELYVEDFIERIELILFHPALRTYTYLTNGSDRLPNSKRPIILRSSNSVLSPESPSAAHSSKPFAGKYRPPSAVKSGPSFEVLFRPAIRREIQAANHGSLKAIVRGESKPANRREIQAAGNG